MKLLALQGYSMFIISRPTITIRIYIIIVTLSFSSCRFNFYSQGCTAAEPNRSNLIGTWMPNHTTLKDMRERGGYDTSVSTKLVLMENGGLEIVNMPDWWEEPFGTSRKGMASYSGSWAIYSDQPCWSIAVKYSNVATYLNLIGNKPPYQIEVILGDPDSGNEMIFVKQEEK